MEVQLHHTGKRFNRKWIFRGIDLTFKPGSRTAITGRNGSGKSTLLLMLAGFLDASEGAVSWLLDGNRLQPQEAYRHISLSSPAMEIIEEFTLAEAIRFHRKFRPFIRDMREPELLDISGLAIHGNKPLRQYSSGMKQRVKLLFSMLCDSELLLLDEPCSHLDREGVDWYQKLMHEFAGSRTIVIASNHNTEEYPEARELISLG